MSDMVSAYADNHTADAASANGVAMIA
jgi:hypothetical protein